MAVAKKKIASIDQSEGDTLVVKAQSPRKKITRTQEERNALARHSMSRAALELFALQGYHATTMSDIGLRAGYSRGLAHHYFGTKDALAELLLDELDRRDTQIQILQVSSTTTGAEAWQRLQRHMETSWKNFCDLHFEHSRDLAERGAHMLRIMATHSTEPALRHKTSRIGRELTDLVENALRLCARDGILRSDIDIRKVALFYIGSIGGMAQVLQIGLIGKSAASAVIEPLRAYLDSLKTI